MTANVVMISRGHPYPRRYKRASSETVITHTTARATPIDKSRSGIEDKLLESEELKVSHDRIAAAKPMVTSGADVTR